MRAECVCAHTCVHARALQRHAFNQADKTGASPGKGAARLLEEVGAAGEQAGGLRCVGRNSGSPRPVAIPPPNWGHGGDRVDGPEREEGNDPTAAGGGLAKLLAGVLS